MLQKGKTIFLRNFYTLATELVFMLDIDMIMWLVKKMVANSAELLLIPQYCFLAAFQARAIQWKFLFENLKSE